MTATKRRYFTVGGKRLSKAQREHLLNVLTEAKKALARPKGWVKGSFMATRAGGGDAYCMVGALRHATGLDGSPGWTDARMKALDDIALAQVLLEDCISEDLGRRMPVVQFNDSSSTKKKDVLAKFDCAIEKVKSHDAS